MMTLSFSYYILVGEIFNTNCTTLLWLPCIFQLVKFSLSSKCVNFSELSFSVFEIFVFFSVWATHLSSDLSPKISELYNGLFLEFLLLLDSIAFDFLSDMPYSNTDPWHQETYDQARYYCRKIETIIFYLLWSRYCYKIALTWWGAYDLLFFKNENVFINRLKVRFYSLPFIDEILFCWVCLLIVTSFIRGADLTNFIHAQKL